MSDLHFTGSSDAMVCKLKDGLEHLDPTIVLLGGDYADSRKGFYHFSKLLHYLAERQHVFAVAGNHDRFFGLQKYRKLFDDSEIPLLGRDSIRLELPAGTIRIDGRPVLQKEDEVDFKILCLHKPIDIRPFAATYNLAFAGHLHGCQFVFRQTEAGLFPGRYFYRWNLLAYRVGPCLYLVSRGLGDTLPIRFNCPKELLLVEVSR